MSQSIGVNAKLSQVQHQIVLGRVLPLHFSNLNYQSSAKWPVAGATTIIG